MATESSHAGWRTWLGLALFVVSIGWPVLIPILPLLGASATVTASFSGAMIVLADLMLLLGAAVAGKEGSPKKAFLDRTWILPDVEKAK
jgi:hypothetical protein